MSPRSRQRTSPSPRSPFKPLPSYCPNIPPYVTCGLWNHWSFPCFYASCKWWVSQKRRYSVSCVRLLSFDIMFGRFTPIVPCCRILRVFVIPQKSISWISKMYPFYSWQTFGLLQVYRTIMTKATGNILIHIPRCTQSQSTVGREISRA